MENQSTEPSRRANDIWLFLFWPIAVLTFLLIVVMAAFFVVAVMALGGVDASPLLLALLACIPAFFVVRLVHRGLQRNSTWAKVVIALELALVTYALVWRFFLSN